MFLILTVVETHKCKSEIIFLKMEILTIILSYFFVSEITAYSITRIQGIDHLVSNVDFDAEGNAYVVSFSFGDTDYRFYKLNPSDEILSTTDIPYYVFEMLVTSRGDTYFHFSTKYNHTLGIVRENSSILEVIDEISSPSELFYLDNNDNLFYSNSKGVSVIRPDSPDIVPIVNLEDFDTLWTVLPISDESGNTYIPVRKLDQEDNSLVLISKEALEEEKPYAIFLDPMGNTAVDVRDLMVDDDNNLWVSSSDGKGNGLIIRLKNGNWETVITHEHGLGDLMVRSKEKTYIMSLNFSDKITSIYVITSNDEVIEIPELNQLNVYNFDIFALTDTEGQVYFYDPDDLSPSLGKIITIKPDELKPISIPLGNNTSGFRMKAVVDFNDDLWIMGSDQEIYHLKKGEIVPDLVNIPCSIYWGIDANFISKKIYVSCASGLFTVKYD